MDEAVVRDFCNFVRNIEESSSEIINTTVAILDAYLNKQFDIIQRFEDINY